MKEIDYIQSLPTDKSWDYVYAWLKENKQGDYLDTLLRFKDFLIKEHREPLPLCPFTGCHKCSRKVKAIQSTVTGRWYVTSPYGSCGTEYCMGVHTGFYETKEEAIEAWKKAVGAVG